MPKTLNKNMFKRSANISYVMKAGKAIRSSSEISDSMRLANQLGVSYSKKDDLEDLINDRLSSFGVSFDFVEPTERLSSADLNIGEVSTVDTLKNQDGFKLSREVNERKVKTLNSLNKNKISVLAQNNRTNENKS